MGRYLVRRLLQMIPVLIGTTFLIYWMVWALPGNPFAGKCGQRPCTDAYIDAQTEKFNLDDPLLIQYFKYLGNLLRGDLGETFAGQDVAELVVLAYPTTVKLALVALTFEAVVGLGAGVLAGLRRGGFIDNFVLISTLIVISLPVFVVGFLLQYSLGIRWGIFPVTVSSEAPFSDLILPGLVLGSISLAYIARLMRSSLTENIRADYVRTANAKGLSRKRVVGVHTVRNSMIPVITFIGADFGALMGGAIITEGIFNINGVGGLVYRSIRLREGATVVAVVTLLVLVFLVMNLLVDLLYAVLDPRIRYE
ncbi:MAG: ABC transporter permease [Actinomycetes bacterium]